MRLHVLSDLHMEFAPFEAPATDANAVILAGDINTGLKAQYERFGGFRRFLFQYLQECINQVSVWRFGA